MSTLKDLMINNYMFYKEEFDPLIEMFYKTRECIYECIGKKMLSHIESSAWFCEGLEAILDKYEEEKEKVKSQNNHHQQKLQIEKQQRNSLRKH